MRIFANNVQNFLRNYVSNKNKASAAAYTFVSSATDVTSGLSVDRCVIISFTSHRHNVVVRYVQRWKADDVS